MKPIEKQSDKASTRFGTYWSTATDQLLSGLNSASTGLSQADAERRLKQYGPNSINSANQTSTVGLLLSQFKSPLVLILVVAAVISAIARMAGRFDRDRDCDWQHDAWVLARVPSQRRY